MEHEGYVEGVLFSVVVRNEVDRFKVVQEGLAEGEHVPDEAVGVLVETLNDLVLLAGVRHKMVDDHPTLNQCLHIELFLEDGLNQAVLLRGLKSLKLISPGVPEGQRLVLVLQLNHKFLLLGLLVEDLISEEDHDDDLVFWHL